MRLHVTQHIIMTMYEYYKLYRVILYCHLMRSRLSAPYIYFQNDVLSNPCQYYILYVSGNDVNSDMVKNEITRQYYRKLDILGNYDG